MTSMLFVGDLNRYSRSHQRYSALKRVLPTVDGLSFVPVRVGDPDGPPPSWSARIRHRLRLPVDTVQINEQLRQQLRAQPYDVLWVEKAPALRIESLEYAAAMHPEMSLVFNSDDDMYAKHNRSHYFDQCLPKYDVVFTAKSFNASPKELPSLGARRVVYVPQAYDPHYHRPVATDETTRVRLGADVGFIGTHESARAETLIELARRGIDVRVFGNGWDRIRLLHPRLRIESKPVYGDDYIRALSATRINLGFLRAANRDRHTSRSLDIPACGAFLLAERTDEHQQLFKEGIEAEYFSNTDELERKIRHYLSNDERRREIAAAGRARCIESDYSHDAALRRMLAYIEIDGTSRP